MNKVNFWFRIRGLLVYFIIIIFLAAIFANWQADKAIELARADMVRTANNCMHTINPSEIMPEMILADGGNNERYKFLKQHSLPYIATSGFMMCSSDEMTQPSRS